MCFRHYYLNVLQTLWSLLLSFPVFALAICICFCCSATCFCHFANIARIFPVVLLNFGFYCCFVVSKRLASFGGALDIAAVVVVQFWVFTKFHTLGKATNVASIRWQVPLGHFMIRRLVLCLYLPVCVFLYVSIFSHANRWCANMLYLHKHVCDYLDSYLLLKADGGIFWKNAYETDLVYINNL